MLPAPILWSERSRSNQRTENKNCPGLQATQWKIPLSVTIVFLGDFFSFCTFQKSDTWTLTSTVCDGACSNVCSNEGLQVSAYLFGFLWELSCSLSGPSTSTVAPGILASRAPQRRKAHPSSKHSNLTTTKSFAKINSNQKGGKVFCRGPRCSWLSRARAMYTWVCASHAGKPPPLWSFAKLREQEEERQVSGHNLLLPGVY